MSTAGGSPAVIRGANGVAPSASPKTTTYETIVDRIGNVRTATGLQIRAELDTGEYPRGRYGDQGRD